jgi:uncharacterized membrane protein SpoIIM required for sporulation
MTSLVSAPTESAFVERRQRDWSRLESALRTARERGVRRLSREQLALFSPLYCDACADLARAQSQRYSAPLLDYLQGLTATAHTVLYGPTLHAKWLTERARGSPLRVALEAFPQAVRRHKVAMLVALLLFFVPLFGGLFATLADASFAARVVPEAQLRPLVEAYARGFEAGRGAGLDAQMAGYYVNNNIGIALRCFATGIALGVGSAFYLVENGLATGAMVGYVVAHGAGDNILTFVVGHSSLELGAIVLAGGAGLVLGWSIVAPGGRTRLASLQMAARSIVAIVFGAATMLALAAAIEGFWSASNVSSVVKRVVGCVAFAIVAAYITLAGRHSGGEPALGGEHPPRPSARHGR